jgi:hypothetical protein
MLRRHVLAVALLPVLVATSPRAAHGLDLRRQYEEDLVRWGLRQAGLEREPRPEGKIIERVEIVREDIIAKTDPWPGFVNWFHVKTRDHVVRQEMLLGPGDLWDEERVEESARNLRKIFILAVVRAVPCKSRVPGRVVLLVVTKDLWSIRLNTNWSMVGSVVQFVELFPTEMNFLGRNKRIALHLRIDQLDAAPMTVNGSITLGQMYVDPRVLGTRLSFVEWVDAIIAGDVPCGGLNGKGEAWCPSTSSGSFEGAYAQLRLRRPLYSFAADWAFDTYAVGRIRQDRRYVVNTGDVPPGERSGLSLKTVAIGPPEAPQHVPRVYDAQELYGTAELTRSFGHTIKHNFTTGMTAYRYRYAPPEGFPFDAETQRAYIASSLPRSEDAAYFAASYQTYATQFVRLRNVDTFALTEDFPLGHYAGFEANFATNLKDASQSYAGGILRLQHVLFARDDLLTLWLDARTRWQPRLAALGQDGPWANTYLDVGLKNAFPRVWLGRPHLFARTILRRNNLDHATSTLGGDSGSSASHGVLRGYPAGQFEGESLLQVSAEYRSEPINLFTVHLGFVLFYDGGSAFGGRDPRRPDTELVFRYHHSVGLGLRVHFPQLDKDAIRLDFGVPLASDSGSPGTWVSFSFRQAFYEPEFSEDPRSKLY